MAIVNFQMLPIHRETLPTNQKLEEFCKINGYEYKVFNQGHCVMVVGPQNYIRWFPSSGRFVKSNKWRTATFHHTEEGVIDAITSYFKWNR